MRIFTKHLQILLSCLLIGMMVLPMTHGIGELTHEHDTEDDHCHVSLHSCSAEDLADSCHLSTFHGVKNACEDHNHLTAQDDGCELCLWAERVGSEGILEFPVDKLSIDSYQSKSLTATQEKQVLYTETNYLRGPPQLVG